MGHTKGKKNKWIYKWSWEPSGSCVEALCVSSASLCALPTPIFFIFILMCLSFHGDLQVQSLMRHYSKWILFKMRLLVRDHKSAALKSQFTFRQFYVAKCFIVFNGKIQPDFPASGGASDKLFIKIIWFMEARQWVHQRFGCCHQSPNSLKCSIVKTAETPLSLPRTTRHR